MASKRWHVSIGDTPGKPKSKCSNTNSENEKSSRKTLFGSSSNAPKPWTSQEVSVLVQYISLYWEDAYTDKWPFTKNMKFWTGCANAINKTCNSSRSGYACRTRVVKHLSNCYSSLSQAEEDLDIDYNLDTFLPGESSSSEVCDSMSPVFFCSPNKKQSDDSCPGDAITSLLSCFESLTPKLKLTLLKLIYKKVALDVGGYDFYKFVTAEFVETSIKSMKSLFDEKKNNVILNLSKCFTKVDNNYRMPMDRMPFGLIDYNTNFFSSQFTQKLGMETHYIEWLTTMYAHFGKKFLHLFRGPVWQYEQYEDQSSDILEDALLESGILLTHPVTTPVIDNQKPVGPQQQENPAPIPNQDMQTAAQMVLPIPMGPQQLENLAPIYNQNTPMVANQVNSAANENFSCTNPVSTLWTHAEKGSEEISSPEVESYHQISPVVAFKRKQNKDIYNPLKSKVNVACIGERQIQKYIQMAGFSRDAKIQVEALKQAKQQHKSGRWWLKADACDVRKGIRESLKCVWAGDEDFGDGNVKALNDEYNMRRDIVTSISTGSYAMGTALLKAINQVNDHLTNDLIFLESGKESSKKDYNDSVGRRISEATLMELAWDSIGYDELYKQCKCLIEEVRSIMMSGKLDSVKGMHSLKTRLLNYIKELFSKKRKAATHLLVFMIADELRNSKPYAIPVRFLPYHSITDGRIRDLEDELERVMESMGMTVVGFSTDGEFNSLRTCGKKRPISVLEITKNSRDIARKTRSTIVANYFQLDEFGHPLIAHEAIPLADVIWLNNLVTGGTPLNDALIKLRKKLFPNNYEPAHWVEGRQESCAEIQKSILAIYIYRKKVFDLMNRAEDPADFSKYLYQPERSAYSSEYVHQREDHNHLLKRIVNCLREGHIPGTRLQLLSAALADPNTGLTYEALTGKNKQSVPDCERLVSPGVIAFLEGVGDVRGAKVIRTIHNWHKAVDGRGLDEATRSRYIQDMKAWILDDWMPWHKDSPDYTNLDVNRSIKGICGLTREVIVGLVANLESRELRRVEYTARGLPPEHPRSSSTDDVEGLFSLLHEMLGPSFDLKQFYDELPKILNEFNKKIDPNLPFYYWTGANVRYRDFALPSFNVPSGPGIVERLDRIKISRRGDPGVFVANRASIPQRGQLTVRATFHKTPALLPPAL